MRRTPALLVVSGLALGVLSAPATGKPFPSRPVRCHDRVDGAHDLTLQVEGQPATGHYTVPDAPPNTLVVFAHGYGHTSYSWIHHMKTASLEHGLAAVTMDNRNTVITPDTSGDGLPEGQGWRVMEGAEDSIAAALAFDKRCTSIENIVIFGVSMGGNTSGLAVAEAGENDIRKSDGTPLFDYWFDIEGAVNVIETYTAARLIAPAVPFAAVAQRDIEQEMGGPIEDVPDAYADHTVVNRMADIEAAELDGAVVVHGLDDGLVPYNQGREMATLLAGSGIATDMVTIARKTPESERETTASGYIGSQLDPNYKSPLAGHASEKSTTHIVMVTSFNRLWALTDEGVQPGPYTETLVDSTESVTVGGSR